eukprot:PhM_4_TR8203/c0_g1_i1/m.15826
MTLLGSIVAVALLLIAVIVVLVVEVAVIVIIVVEVLVGEGHHGVHRAFNRDIPILVKVFSCELSTRDAAEHLVLATAVDVLGVVVQHAAEMAQLAVDDALVALLLVLQFLEVNVRELLLQLRLIDRARRGLLVIGNGCHAGGVGGAVLIRNGAEVLFDALLLVTHGAQGLKTLTPLQHAALVGLTDLTQVRAEVEHLFCGVRRALVGNLILVLRVKANLAEVVEEAARVARREEIRDGSRGELRTHLVEPLWDLRHGLAHRAVRLHHGLDVVDLGEDLGGLEELGVELLRRLEALTRHEHLGGLHAGRERLRGLDLFEELLHDPNHSVVLLSAENLCDEPAAGLEHLTRELAGLEDKLVLRKGLSGPHTTDIWGTVVEHDLCLLSLQCVQDLFARLIGVDVACDGFAPGDGLNGDQIDADDCRRHWHVLGTDLHPATWGGAQVDHSIGLIEEAVLSVELHELEGGAGAVALLLGKVVELVQAVLSLLFVLSHFYVCFD